MLALLGDVGVGAEPTDDMAFLVANRLRAREEPAVLAVFAAHRERVFVVLTSSDRRVVIGHHLRAVIGMDYSPPTLVDRIVIAEPGELVPALVEPEDVPVGIGHPGELADVLGKRAKAFLALAHRLLDAKIFANVAGHLAGTDDLPVRVAHGRDADLDVEQLAVLVQPLGVEGLDALADANAGENVPKLQGKRAFIFAARPRAR